MSSATQKYHTHTPPIQGDVLTLAVTSGADAELDLSSVEGWDAAEMISIYSDVAALWYVAPETGGAISAAATSGATAAGAIAAGQTVRIVRPQRRQVSPSDPTPYRYLVARAVSTSGTLRVWRSSEG